MGRLVALAAWGAAAGLYLYIVASARWRADARRHRCHLNPAPPQVDIVQRLADQVVAEAERICAEATR